MDRKIFVNLPVKNLNKSIEFFKKLGFDFNPQFTDQNAACMIIGTDSFVMLLVESFFKRFTKKEIADAEKNTETMIAFSAPSRPHVDEIMEKAIAAGAAESRDPEDHGWMYGRSFEDLDRHIWEAVYMDMNAVKKEES